MSQGRSARPLLLSSNVSPRQDGVGAALSDLLPADVQGPKCTAAQPLFDHLFPGVKTVHSFRTDSPFRPDAILMDLL